MKKIGVCIIGSGRMGERHAEAYEGILGVKLVGFFDIDRNRAQVLADRHSAKAFSDIEALIRHEEVDAVNICTPNAEHVCHAVIAAKAGKHVFVEKPLATTLKDCDIMIRAARKAGIKAMVGQTHRFYPSNIAAKQLINDGTIGSIKMIQDYYMDPGFLVGGQVPAWIKGKESGGIMTDSVHFVDRISWYAGQKINRVHTHVLNRLRQESKIDEISMVSLKLAGGGNASLMTISPSWGVKDNQTTILGTKGIIYVKYGEEVKIGTQQWKTHDFPFRSSPPTIEHNLAGFRNEFGEFVSSIVEDREPAVTLEDGRRAVRVVLAIQESHTSGKPVDIR